MVCLKLMLILISCYLITLKYDFKIIFKKYRNQSNSIILDVRLLNNHI